nr:hypothetical transcript [Hymenolepis microstoma]
MRVYAAQGAPRGVKPIAHPNLNYRSQNFRRTPGSLADFGNLSILEDFVLEITVEESRDGFRVRLGDKGFCNTACPVSSGFCSIYCLDYPVLESKRRLALQAIYHTIWDEDSPCLWDNFLYRSLPMCFQQSNFERIGKLLRLDV